MWARNLALSILLLLTSLGAFYLRHPESWSRRIPGNAMAVPVSSSPAGAPVAFPSLSATSPQTHGMGFSNACSSPPVRAVETVESADIYRWVDEQGSVHFGDSAPAGAKVSAYDTGLPDRLQYFTLNVRYVGSGRVAFLEDRLSVSATEIYKTIAGLIGDERLRQVALELRIYAEQEEYRHFAASIGGPRLADAGGFYTLDRNLAVTYRYPDDSQTLAVARHEAVHVILAGVLGPRTPGWLNEGMAEYFENLRTRGQYSEVPVDQTWLNLARRSLASGYPASLTDYLLLDDERWYGDRQQVHYALGWSLVYFLMVSPEGRTAMGGLLRQKADGFCAELDSPGLISLAWPGGMRGFEQDFRRWLQGAPDTSLHRF